MKRTIIFTLFTILFISVSCFAQTGKAAHVPKWVTQNGYWVVETNTHNLKSSIIYFYNDSNEVVYKENVEGMIVKTQKRSVKMKLKKVLDESLLAYNIKHKTAANEMLVLNQIKRH
ncbi:MAG: hypothetical protein IPL97_09205 [Niastella sp.]|nr:hypothetical protein [Niastella sp.]